MKSKYIPFVDYFKLTAPSVLNQLIEKISNPKLQIRLKMWLQVILANNLSSSKSESIIPVNLIGLEIGCLLKKDLPEINLKAYRAGNSLRSRRSKWVDVVLSDIYWETWLWLELKALKSGENQKLMEFIFVDILGRLKGDSGVNEIDANATLDLFSGDNSTIMKRNKALLKCTDVGNNYLRVRNHIKAGLLFWIGNNMPPLLALEKEDRQDLNCIKLDSNGSYSLFLIHPINIETKELDMVS